MRKKYVILLILTLLVTIFIGTFLILTIYGRDIVDRSIVLFPQQIVFILSIGVLILLSLIFMLSGLRKYSKTLKNQQPIELKGVDSDSNLGNKNLEGKEENNYEESRFFMLSLIDEQSKKYKNFQYEDEVTL
ncbi:hypothetical protein, partial [Acholeplasma equifetale]|uniref:hypothetical protein n=1 Tax=Acholeplasma equifetale TaxID=264634 RepID=UPI00054F24F8